MSTSTTFDLHHIVRPSSRPIGAPLLILLHGYGSDENDLFAFASELPEEFCIISLRAPLPMAPHGYAWYAINFEAEQGKWSDTKQAIASRDNIAKIIDQAVAAYSVNKHHVTLLGFSQGAILSYAVALTYPEKVKNVVALSGYLYEAILPKEWPSKAAFSKLNIYASHGTSDQVIPVAWARQVAPFLSKYGIAHAYSEFPVGHGVSPDNFYSFKDWLLDHL